MIDGDGETGPTTNPFTLLVDKPCARRSDVHTATTIGLSTQPSSSPRSFNSLRILTILIVISGLLRITISLFAVIWSDAFLTTPPTEDLNGFDLSRLEDSSIIPEYAERLPDYRSDPADDKVSRDARIVSAIEALRRISAVLLIATLVPWVIFAAQNTRCLCRDKSPLSPRIGAFVLFVPLLNIIFCGIIFLTIWRYSHSHRANRGNLIFAIFSIAIPSTLLFLALTRTVAVATRNITLLLVGELSSIAIPVLVSIVVVCIDYRQTSTYRTVVIRNY